MYIALALVCIAGLVLFLCWMAPWAWMFGQVAKRRQNMKSRDDRELESLSRDLKEAESRLLHKHDDESAD